MLHALLSALSTAGHDVTAFITDTSRPNTYIDGVKVVYDAKPWMAMSSQKYDVLMSQFQNTPEVQSYANMVNRPHVHIVHNDNPITMHLVKKAKSKDLVVFNTHWIQNKCSTTAPSIVVHPPVDGRAVSLGVSDSKTREYVTLVNLTKAKGVETFYGLAREFPDVKFLGVKGGYDKGRQVLSDLENVTIIENTPDMVSEVYDRSKVVLMPSSYETYGMVAAEAIANGIPVIATQTDGLRENLGSAGIYPEEDGSSWRDRLHNILTDDEFYKRASEEAMIRHKQKNSEEELKVFVAAVERLLDRN